MDSPLGFTIAGQFGDPEAGNTLWPHAVMLKEAFAKQAVPFSDDLREIAFLLRGDGRIQQFNFEGHDNIVVDRKDNAISVDIGVPMARWVGRTPSEIASYLSQCCMQSIPDVVRAATAKGLQVDMSDVQTRVRSALDEYRLRAVEPNR